MSINSISPQSEIACRNKLNSDIRESLTDELTIKGSHLNSSHGKAARQVRDIIDRREFNLLSCLVDSQAYYDDLM